MIHSREYNCKENKIYILFRLPDRVVHAGQGIIFSVNNILFNLLYIHAYSKKSDYNILTYSNTKRIQR